VRQPSGIVRQAGQAAGYLCRGVLQRTEFWHSEASANNTQFTGALEPYKYPSAKRNRRGNGTNGERQRREILPNRHSLRRS
jgi:hypothetical protein